MIASWRLVAANPIHRQGRSLQGDTHPLLGVHVCMSAVHVRGDAFFVIATVAGGG
jgi:hypothetical protein